MKKLILLTLVSLAPCTFAMDRRPNRMQQRQQQRNEQAGAWVGFTIGTLAAGATIATAPAGLIMGGALGIIMQEPTIRNVAISALGKLAAVYMAEETYKAVTKK